MRREKFESSEARLYDPSANHVGQGDPAGRAKSSAVSGSRNSTWPLSDTRSTARRESYASRQDGFPVRCRARRQARRDKFRSAGFRRGPSRSVDRVGRVNVRTNVTSGLAPRQGRRPQREPTGWRASGSPGAAHPASSAHAETQNASAGRGGAGHCTVARRLHRVRGYTG
jgi:hypothetical protein